MSTYSNDIKSRVSMADVCNLYGIEIVKNKIFCPFHSDKRPSLHIYDGSRGFCCFACGKTGSVIDFTMKLFSLGFSDACKKLNDDFRLGLPLGGEKLSRSQLIEAERKSAELRRAVKERKRKRERLESAYHAALDGYVQFDRLMIDNKPPTIKDGINDKYAFALRHIGIAEYRLECAEIALYLNSTESNSNKS